jgi:hypothetical protein
MRDAVIARRKVVYAARKELKRLKEIPFDVLVKAAYPEKYPEDRMFPDADPCVHRPSVFEIQIAVCRAFNVSRGDLLSDRKNAPIVLPRQIAMALSRRLTLQSLPRIGRQFGGRDHTTILHAVQKMQPIMVRVEADVPVGALLDVWVERAKAWAYRIKVSCPSPRKAKVVEISS